MKGAALGDMTVPQLVERFTTITLNQFQAELYDEIAKYNRLISEMLAIEQELKNRPGDQRSALVPLFAHPNPQVRLMAAELTLAVAPAAARQTLQEIWDRREFPQAAYAMGTLRALERGDRKPT
ncbi:MAG: DUF2019 domain-containing protein [Rhizobiales bacterium]|nr:DUF2019 domain-containing protein [Hyphomicrobiales bacterium]